MARYIDKLDDAAALLNSAKRICVVGCSGSGKSTLSQILCERLGLDYISMDRDVFWLPGWKLRPRPEALELMHQFVAGERWIIDGNSPGSLPARLARADMVIWMRPPRHLSIYGVLSRWLKHRGTVRPEMAPGCPEKIDWPFLQYVWNFEAKEVPQFQAQFENARADLPVVVLRSHRQTNEFLAALGGCQRR
ncbi:AAA family ATPase [Agrobacterium vitis]|uniref:AAA family ATPase n=1 Tax=Agrobacterium vitis TaxID=373 RepID=A0AAE4WBF6_AGRVI|nr:AAA family ATPase [Agrobacterium vitis]MCF1496694.1 AAA family ATPase [Allorhizobium sp. Av2]MCM2439770.1 AAA family ATPase [Agrobacterium vitis]MUZ57333.1 AAA family ATPase [Agrobacterium vitis]MVA65642.1 AAA family ATPase [Agrobacterium vitis]MVA86667.1 AAA family ATPase [Agrobacterium vitis]